MKKKHMLFVWFMILVVVLNTKGRVFATSDDETQVIGRVIDSVEDLPSGFVDYLQENNVSISDNSFVRITRPTIDGETGKASFALIVVNNDEEEVNEDVFLFCGDETTINIGSNQLSSILSQEKGNRASAYTDVDFPGQGYNFEITIHARAVYYKYYYSPDLATVLQPQGFSYTYQKNVSCTIDRILILYQTQGIKYTYPGFVGYYNDIYNWTITKDQYSPATYTTYARYYPLTDYAIDPGSTGLGCHQFNFQIEGDNGNIFYYNAVHLSY